MFVIKSAETGNEAKKRIVRRVLVAAGIVVKATVTMTVIAAVTVMWLYSTVTVIAIVIAVIVTVRMAILGPPRNALISNEFLESG